MPEFKINIVLPVYNEEKRLESGLKQLIEYLKTAKFESYVITIADNASTDKTRELAARFCKEDERIHYFKICQKGLGIAFREACRINTCPVIGYMDIDMSTELSAFIDMVQIFQNNPGMDMVHASRYDRKSVLKGRTWLRDFVGYTLIALLKCTFKMKASDAICGFKFFKAETVNRLLDKSGDEKGWFLIIEMLLRAERDGCQITELPVTWTYDKNSKVKIISTTANYIVNIIRLRKEFSDERH